MANSRCRRKKWAMKLMYKRCAGLDVHQRTVVACVRIVEDTKLTEEVRTFETTTTGLLALSAWLEKEDCTQVAMEATGVYWKPVWHILEAKFELVLANAAHIKNVPGRKTDVNDARWVADLLAHGLIRGSFVPPTPIQDLRALMRTRKQLVREAARNTQRIQKALEDANIKLTGVVSDILGKSGRAVLDALAAGETDPEKLVERTGSRLKASREVLVEALRGNVREHHRFLIKLHLDQIDALNKAVCELEARVDAHVDPFRLNIKTLTTMPGISETAARVIVSEIGHDMARFPTAAHLVSWAGLCPRSDESAGKRRSSRIRHGAPWLKTTLVQCLGRHPHEGQLLAGPVPSPKITGRPDEGDHRGHRVDAHRGVPHAQHGQRLQGSRRCSPRQTRPRQDRQASRPSPRRPRPQGHFVPRRFDARLNHREPHR